MSVDGAVRPLMKRRPVLAKESVRGFFNHHDVLLRDLRHVHLHHSLSQRFELTQDLLVLTCALNAFVNVNDRPDAGLYSEPVLLTDFHAYIFPVSTRVSMKTL